MNYYRNEPARKPSGQKSGKKSRKKLIIAIGVVALAALVFAAVNLITIYAEYAAGESEYNDLAQLGPTTSGGVPLLNPGEMSAQNVDAIDFDSINFDELRKINKDVVGWIFVAGTPINYPIVKSPENDNNYYVKRTYKKEENPSGAIFLDYRNAGDFSDKNSVIYGHNMKNGTMFHSLIDFQKQDFFDSHKLGYIITPDKIFKLDIFSVFVTSYNVPYRTMKFLTDKDFESFIKEYTALSEVKSDVTVGAKDKIVTLSTCTYEYNDARLAVMAKITPYEP